MLRSLQEHRWWWCTSHQAAFKDARSSLWMAVWTVESWFPETMGAYVGAEWPYVRAAIIVGEIDSWVSNSMSL